MGALVGALVGYSTFRMFLSQIKRKKQSMNMGEDLRIEQNIAGRLRAYSVKLKSKKIGEALTVQLVRIEGIDKVLVNPVTGSILITYDAKKVDNNLLIPALMKLLGLDLESEMAKKSLIMNEAGLINKSVNKALMDQTKGVLDLDTLIPLGFLGLAIKEILRTGTLGTPTPLTLLYWSYSSLIRGDVQK